MSLLVERQFQPFGTSHDAIATAGGLWVPKSPAIKGREVIAEAKDRGEEDPTEWSAELEGLRSRLSVH